MTGRELLCSVVKFTAMFMVIGIAHSQDYTRRFPWIPGRLTVPEDGTPVPSPNRVYVQMPNITKVLTARIRKGVNTTLDCGLPIDKITANPATRNHYTYWTLFVRQFDGSLSADPANVTAGEYSTGLEIFGDNDRFLRSANPQIASSAKQSNIGVFTCHFCYEEFDPLTRDTVHSTCTNSSSDINVSNFNVIDILVSVIVFPTYIPTIDRNQSSVSDPNIRIGRTLCLDTFKDRNAVVSVICSQLGTINPKPTANFTFNGNPIVNGVLFAVQGEVLTILPGFYQSQGKLTCVLSNPFGNDTETTLILFNATSNFSGTINGVSDSQCPANTPSNVLCPGNGQQVNLNCATNFMNSINITSPDSTTVTNRNLSFTVGPNDYGTYTCTAFNECDQSLSTVVLQQCTLPDICLLAPQTGDSQPIDSHCFGDIQSMAGAAIGYNVKFNCSNENEDSVTLTKRMWFIDGVLQTTANFQIPITQPGNYTCVVTHGCGTIQSHLVSIPQDPPAITTGNSTVLNPSGPVTVGNTVCLNASSSNPSVQLDCVISNPVHSNPTNITWSPGGTSQDGVTSASLTVTMTGTYTCTAANDCGITNASSVVRTTPTANITGSVAGISGNGCSEASSGKSICANVGMSVTIMCNVSPGDSYIITGAGRSSFNKPLMFTVTDDSYGNYTCMSANPCASTTDTNHLERAVSNWFCNQSQTESQDFGVHTWPESVGNTTLTLPCGNRPMMNVTRMCQINGDGWRNPDYTQCETLVCENVTIVTNRGTFQWPVTPVESLAFLTCPHGPIGARAIRQCRRNGVWETHDTSNCADPGITTEFVSIADTNVTAENVVQVAQNLSNVVMLASQPGDQNENNLHNVSSLLNQTANLFSSPDVIITLSSDEVSMATESTVEILDSVQEWPSPVVATQSNNIIQSFERIVDAFISQDNFTNLTIIETGIALQGLRVQRTDFTSTTFFGSSINNSLSVGTTDNLVPYDFSNSGLATIRLPATISNVTRVEDISLAFAMYTQSTLFPIRDPINLETVVGSPIISASVDGIADGTALADAVNVNLRITFKNVTNFHCVYWNFTAAGGRGNWSTDGCTTTVDSGTNDTVTCSCNHLTNFACLVDISTRTGNTPPSPSVTVVLEIVTYIGVILSLVGLVLTILTLLIFKSLRQRDSSKFHIQLCLSLIFMLIVFVVGIDRVSVRAGCITVGVLIHYFALVAWMWMGAEAVLMFQKLVIVFTHLTWKYFLIVSIACWGLPLLPVAIVLSVDVDHYITFYKHTKEGFCFLGQLSMFLTAFFVPVMFILILNSIIYILVLCVLILHAVRKNKRLQKSSMKLSQAIKMLLSFTGIMFLFGLTWIFAVFTFISEPGVSYTVQFLFAFFNAFQGFFIFVFFVVLSSDSRAEWKSLLCPCMANNEQQTSKYNLSSLNNKKKRSPNSNTYSSTSFESKSNTLNEKSVLANLSETGNENSLSKEDNVPASLAIQEKKSDDLNLVQLKGTHMKCHSTSTHASS